VIIGLLCQRERLSHFLSLLPPGHTPRHLQLRRDGYETADAYQCDLLVISLRCVPKRKAIAAAKRLRDVGIGVLLTELDGATDPRELQLHANAVLHEDDRAGWWQVTSDFGATVDSEPHRDPSLRDASPRG
jgi:hypothetical protein